MPIPPDLCISSPEPPTDAAAVALGFERLADCSDEIPESAGLISELDANEVSRRLVSAIFATSPFLTQLVLHHPGDVTRFIRGEAEALLDEILAETAGLAATAADKGVFMANLRALRSRTALVAALADLSGQWPIEQVCRQLTAFADAAIASAVDWLLLDQAERGKMLLKHAQRPSEECGYVVLAMGKHGARELNYSSDVDLIVLYDPDTAPLAAGTEAATLFVRLTKQLVGLLQEITADGYVFRVDLRLRPDPRATQVAIAFEAACIYYESMGQNWERAAMIKARPIAGDMALGEEFLGRLVPYIWRKYLDFATIADVQSLKRQIHAVKGHATINIPGHNIKLGRGGIREIEFFVQTQQLIAGGRNPELRGKRTLEMLDGLARAKWITPEAAAELRTAYGFLRQVEHRIQMIGDEQSHELPDQSEALEAFARFCGFAGFGSFAAALLSVLGTVQTHYSELFEDAEQLASETGSLVFTGGEDDPETVATLAGLGFSQPSEVSATIRGWHFGRYAATRSAQARERLTELMPQLLKAISSAGDPDKAFVAFDRFISHLPAGLQLFSMLRANPHLLNLLATILGTAPLLAEQLSQRPRVFDAVLDPGFFDYLPDSDEISAAIDEALGSAANYEELLDATRVIGHEHMFRIGVRIISETINAADAGRLYATIADTLIAQLLRAVCAEVEDRHGKLAGGQVGVIAMGQVGGREMTAGSELDLILIYDHDPDGLSSDGARPLMVTQYYARVTQRLIAALSSPTAEGVLYDVDMRLRPSGSAGPVATSIDSFRQYQRETAWTWEKLALTRARAVAGDAALVDEVKTAIAAALAQPRDAAKTLADIVEMRRMILAEHGTDDSWNIKHVRGGLVDLEFIAQALQLIHGPGNPSVFNQNTSAAIEALADAGLLSAEQRRNLIEASQVYHRIIQVLRLCVSGRFDPETAPGGLRQLVLNATASPDIATAEALLADHRATVSGLFDELIGTLD